MVRGVRVGGEAVKPVVVFISKATGKSPAKIRKPNGRINQRSLFAVRPQKSHCFP